MSIFDHIYLLFAGFENLSSQSQNYLIAICAMLAFAFSMSIYSFYREIRSWRIKRQAEALVLRHHIADLKSVRYHRYPGQ